MRLKFLIVSLILVTSAWAQAPSVRLSDLTANNTSAVRRAAKDSGSPGNVSKLPIRALLYPGSTTKIFVRVVPWFGDAKHIDMGYRSSDRRQVALQIADMKQRGIDGAIMNWYGPNDPKNASAEALMRESERAGLLFAISIDTGAFSKCREEGCDQTDEMISLVNYVLDRFASSPAYWKVGSRPVLPSFGLEKRNIDWHRVRRAAKSNPMFIFRNSGGFKAPESDGAFAWIAPETVSNSDPLALEYLDRFYRTAQQNSDKFAMGSVYKGFDDSAASWTKNRRIDERCGETWLTTFSVLNKYYSNRRQLDALIIPTWNDYEEGTAIEPGIENCVDLKASVDGSKLRIELSGQRDTVDHLTVFAMRGSNLNRISDLPPNANTLELPKGLTANALVVLAVGKPSMRNHVSVPIPLKRQSR